MRRRDTRLSAFDEAPRQVAAAPVAEEPPALSVTQAVAAVNGALAEPPFADVWVRGEISGFKAHGSGHWYFSLKDESALLAAAMFRQDNVRVRFRPEEGMEVLARGRLVVYAPRGQFQLVVQEIRPEGAGALALAFDQLRRRLESEGLFDPARKRPLPPFPRAVGIVTSLQGAALRDLVHVATRRHPGIRLVVCGARVQGEGAAEEIARAVARLNDVPEVDVLIVGRGGGSVEDLWAFNEEVVVRAVAASRVPVVSAVGHETDVTLCDFAADLRAATPSAAAETVVPEAAVVLAHLDDRRRRLEQALRRLVPDLRQEVDDLADRVEASARRALALARERLGARAGRLGALSPLGVLARGYSVTFHDGRLVRRVDDAPVGGDVEIRVRDGRLQARVLRAKKEETHAEEDGDDVRG